MPQSGGGGGGGGKSAPHSLQSGPHSCSCHNPASAGEQKPRPRRSDLAIKMILAPGAHIWRGAYPASADAARGSGSTPPLPRTAWRSSSPTPRTRAHAPARDLL
eukprot:gene25797-biopygen13556